jgi:hypothetical protein
VIPLSVKTKNQVAEKHIQWSTEKEYWIKGMDRVLQAQGHDDFSIKIDLRRRLEAMKSEMIYDIHWFNELYNEQQYGGRGGGGGGEKGISGDMLVLS